VNRIDFIFKIKLTVIIVCLCGWTLQCQSKPPKRELRGAWIATIADLDWPSSYKSTSAEQISKLKSIIDSLKSIGFNAVFFQVRSECDAMYESKIEPWSFWLTGVQGKAPNPFFDPLKIAIDEAHKNGMELHAWFNPFRAVNNLKNYYPKAYNHITKLYPDWIVTYGDIKMLNPGLPQVRKYIVSVIMDVVRRYDIDGVHLDDYFYPYPQGKLKFKDDAAFKKYQNGFYKNQKDDWRRNNINEFIKMLHDSIMTVKPFIKFGVSPFGIWKSGVPEGITGFSSYDKLYADAAYWLNHKLIDYAAPQLYWSFGGKQDYGKLLRWWSSITNGRQLYAGQAAYKINNFGAEEIMNQIRDDRKNKNVFGSILYRARDGILDNPNGIADSLKNNLFRYQSLVPVMAWKDSIPPNPPQKLEYSFTSNSTGIELKWKSPSIARDGDSAFRYVVYKFDAGYPNANDLNAENIVCVTGEKKTFLNISRQGSKYFAVTSLDRAWNESYLSNIVRVVTPYFVSSERLNPFEVRYTQDYSNPFDSTVKINYNIKKRSFILIKIYNMFGKIIFSNEGRMTDAGNNSFSLSLKSIYSGVYFIRIISRDKNYFGKIFLYN